jgi:hypothetical protein
MTDDRLRMFAELDPKGEPQVRDDVAHGRYRGGRFTQAQEWLAIRDGERDGQRREEARTLQRVIASCGEATD